MSRRIRVGVIADDVRSPEALIALAKWAEEAGFSTLLLRDHVVEHPFGHQLGPLASMTLAAVHTTTLRIGSLVFSNDFRPPVQLAKEIATIDVISGGRVELGLGAGFLQSEYAPLGIPFDSPGKRVSRLGESIGLLRRLFQGGAVTFSGEHYAVDGFTSYPPPAQGESLPILVAGSGDRMLRLAAREANIVGLQTVTTTSGSVVAEPGNWFASTVQRKVDLIREAAGTRFRDLELNTTVTVEVCDDRDTGARQAIARRGWDGVAVAEVLDMPAVLIGTLPEIVRQARNRRDRFGISYLVVDQAQASAIAPIIPELA